MAAVEILDNLFFVERGYLNGNHFIYRSEEPVLIDTAYKADFEETAGHLGRLGIDPARVRLIINTHCHCDHLGGNKIIQDLSGCEIALHRIGRHFIDTHDDWSTWWRYFVQEADFFRCTKVLEDGDMVSIGPHEFQVIYTPGHAIDGTVLYNRREKLLISSDTLWESDMAVMNVRVEGSGALFAMMDSLDKLARLDVRIVYPGHGAPFTNMHAALARARKRLKGFLENRQSVGNDLIKKIIVYTLMMRREVEEEGFFPYLMGTPWFVETTDFYFDGEYHPKYEEIMASFLRRGIVKRESGKLRTTVKP